MEIKAAMMYDDAAGITRELYENSLKTVFENKTASTSLLQRKLCIGYARAASVIDKMIADGIIERDGDSYKYSLIVTEEECKAIYESKNTEKSLKPIERVCDFLKRAGVYYLATVEGDQPRVRPFGTANIFEDKLYIQTGRIKPTSRQLSINPKCEISAFLNGEWIRVCCELCEDDRVEAKRAMLDAYPNLRGMYDENDGNTQVFYMKGAVASFQAFGKPSEILEF